MNRAMRVLLALLLVGALSVMHQSRASADLIWCIVDPVLIVDGKAVNLTVSVPQDQRQSVVSSSLVVTGPANVDARLAGASALNFPVSLNLIRAGTYAGAGPVPVTATATIVALPGMPTRLAATQPSVGPLAATTGVSGTPMTVSFAVR